MKRDVGLSFCATSRRRPRRNTALVACCAVVLQALVFAWHHHELPFASRGSLVVVAAASGSQAPASADRDCPICSAIAHHGAVPVGLFAAAPPQPVPLGQPAPAAILGYLAPYLLFHPRAPPRA